MGRRVHKNHPAEPYCGGIETDCEGVIRRQIAGGSGEWTRKQEFEEENNEMKPPIVYYGGKTYHAPWIVDVMKRYKFKAYIEPFGGSGAILFAKEPSPVEVYNDLYSDLVTFYRVLRNPKTCEEFIRFIENSP
jgi:hypothetical protein